MMRKRIDREQAISPVVGVMLMLVVTIIIAAVVSAFAGGLSTGTKETPQASIDVKISTTGGGMDNSANAKFTLLSGNPILTKDLAIITYYTNSSGHVYKHEQTASSGATDLYGPLNYTQYCEWGYTDYCGIGSNVRSLGRVPFLSDMRYGYAGSKGDADSGWVGDQNLHADFGNYTWNVGDVMVTNGDPGTADLFGINDDGDPHAIGDPDFRAGSVVDVKILYIPSGKYIYDKEVIVS